jgi:hypothetical protein
VPRVLRRDKVGFAQNAQGAQGDIFEIPDRGGNQREQLKALAEPAG